MLVLLLPENRLLSDAERAELRVARASFAASGIPERGAQDLLTVAETTTVSAITTWLLTTGGSALRTLFDHLRGHKPPEWDFERAWSKVRTSAAAVAPHGSPPPALLSAMEDPATHEWRIACTVAGERYIARTDQSSPIVLWDRSPATGANPSP